MSDLYCVFGNPIAHSRSPAIHAAFAATTGEDLRYEARLAPVGCFARPSRRFVASGGRAPMSRCRSRKKLVACPAAFLRALLGRRCQYAGFPRRRHFRRQHRRCWPGAGYHRQPRLCVEWPPHPVAGRRWRRARRHRASTGLQAGVPVHCQPKCRKSEVSSCIFAGMAAVSGGSFAELAGEDFDLVISATSASLVGESATTSPPVRTRFACLRHDVREGRNALHAVVSRAGSKPVRRRSGHAGRQAAEAFYVWRGIRPPTATVLADLRRQISA